MSDLVDMTPAELEYALLLAKEQMTGSGHTYPMQALRADKFARGLIEQHARAVKSEAASAALALHIAACPIGKPLGAGMVAWVAGDVIAWVARLHELAAAVGT